MTPRKFFIGRAIGFVVILAILGVGYFFFKQTPAFVPAPQSVGNGVEKSNLIRLTSPLPNATVSSPLTITGEARGTWFFEASFPIYITDWDGKIIGEGFATAQSDWITTDFVPFTATLTFNTAEISGQYSKRGTLILKKDNPSGLPEHDDALEIPVHLK